MEKFASNIIKYIVFINIIIFSVRAYIVYGVDKQMFIIVLFLVLLLTVLFLLLHFRKKL